MKKLLVILLVLGFCLSVAWATTTLTYEATGKTMVGPNYLVWGTFGNASSEAGNIVTGLKTIYAFGLNITSEATFPSPLKTELNAGTIVVTATQESKAWMTTPEAASTPDGYWWGIGH